MRADLNPVASWLKTERDCRLWSGSRVSFPVDLTSLPDEIEFEIARSWCAEVDGRLGGFVQLVPKPLGRLHLARLIVAPGERGRGLGRWLAGRMVDLAHSSSSALSLNVDPANAPALAVYKRLGFLVMARPADEPPSTSLYMEHRDHA